MDPLDERARGLSSIRRTATGILAALAAVFGATLTVSDPPTWLLLVRSMAEAGMVGGLADWFAVEALFRRPLGLPIPHTALLPRNQQRAASNIARFIDEYFLTPEQLVAQLRAIDPVGQIAVWLSDRGNAQSLARELVWFLAVILRGQVREGLSPEVGRFLSQTLARSLDTQALSQNVTAMVQTALRGEMLDEIMDRVRESIAGNRPQMLKLVQDRSRWWISTTVDKRILDVLLDGVQSVISELSQNRSELRMAFEQGVSNTVQRLHDDGRIAHFIDEGLRQFSGTDEFAQTLSDLAEGVLKGLAEDVDRDPDRYSELLAEAIVHLAERLRAEPDLKQDLNARLVAALETGLEQIRPAIMRYIATTISGWDSDELVARIEGEVGRDLQFIRINGAVLGALVGGVIFGIGHFFGAP